MGTVRALWAVPRSASTAFERMVIERGDHQVLDEPFSAAYYDGPERRSPRFDETAPAATVPALVEHVDREAAHGPVFLKDMASHVGSLFEAGVCDRWRHAFLVRDPRWSIPSMARIWPDLTEEEAGFTAMVRLVRELRERGGTPLVVDSHELCRDPEATVARWCAAMGLAPDPDALHWDGGMRPEWQRWRDWYAATARSTGFGPPPDGDPPAPQSAHVADLVARAQPLYEELRSAAGAAGPGPAAGPGDRPAGPGAAPG